MLVIDNLIDMATADADGTQITTAILDTGTQGTPQGTWSIVGTASALTIQSSGGSTTDRKDSCVLRDTGTQYAANATHRRIALANSAATTAVQLTTAGGLFHACTLSGWITINAANAGVSGQVFDLIRLDNNTGDYAIFQLNNGNGPGVTYAINLHTNPGGVSTQTGWFTITPGSTHYFSLFFDSFNATSTLKLYDTSGALETSITAATNTGKDYIAFAKIGNLEVGTSTGTNYFENMMFDWTHAANPLGPVGSTNYWLEKAATNAIRTSVGSLTVAVPNISLGDLVVVCAKWEGGTTTATCSDGTNALTATTVGVVNNPGTAGDPHEVMFYTLSSLKSGTVTYTVTFGANRVEVDLSAMAFTAPVGAGAISLDGTAHANTAASGTAVDSSNQTTTGTNGMSVAWGAGFGSHFLRTNVNSVRCDYSNEVGGLSAGFSMMWATAYTAGFTSSAAATLSASNNWDAQIVSFNAPTTGYSVTWFKL